MSSLIALERLFDSRQVWRGQGTTAALSTQPTGHAALDKALPGGGWPDSALSEILIAAPGIGELRLLWPTLARLSQKGERVVLVGPPHVPYPHAWLAAGVDLRQLTIVDAAGHDALWATEQCLRSGSCGAVVCWPRQVDDRALRRLQIAAETGKTLTFAYRPLEAAANASPAALRLSLDASQLRILKCRGGIASAQSFAAPALNTGYRH